jgi:transcriptional regulator with XRE-family HTH domain
LKLGSVRRPNPVFSPEYRALIDVVAQARRDAGLSQRDLSSMLGKTQSHICMIERGQRRIDALELYQLANFLSVDPASLFDRIARRVRAVEQTEAMRAEPLASAAPSSPDDPTVPGRNLDAR